MNPSIHEELEKLTSELKKLQSAVEHIKQAEDAAQSAVDAAASYQGTMVVHGQLAEKANGLSARIEAIDFPARFEKMGTTLTGIAGSISALSPKLDAMEKKLLIRQDELEQKQSLIFAGVVTTIKKKSMVVVLLLVLVILLIAADIAIPFLR